MPDPRFSIVIPCYNAAKTLPATLASVAAQDFRHYEILAVDDGSTDETAEFLREASQKERRLRVLSQPNSGVSRARNAGIASARGEIVAFLDADDLWTPDKLSRHDAQFAADPDLAVAYARIRFLTPEGDPTRVTSNRPIDGLTARDLLAENVACTTSNLLARRSIFVRIGRFNPALSFDEDKEWLFRAFINGERIQGLDAPLTGYRTSPNGLAADLDHAEREWRRYVEIVRPLAPKAVAAAERQAEAIFLRNLARRALRLGQEGKVGRWKALGLLARAACASLPALFIEPRRTWMTCAAACVSAVLPERMRRRFSSALEATPSKLNDLRGSS